MSKQQSPYLGGHTVLTFALTATALLMYAGAMPVARFVFLLVCAAGFAAAWAWRNQSWYGLTAQIISTVGAVAGLLWAVYAVMTSRFSYTEVILALAQGGCVVACALSFSMTDARLLGYQQLLSVPLCLGAVLFADTAKVTFPAFAVLYCFLWVGALRVRWFEFFPPSFETSSQLRYLAGVPAAVAAGLLVCAGIVTATLQFIHIKQGGLLPVGRQELEDEVKEKKLYEIQDAIQRELTSKLYAFGGTEEQHNALAYMAAMIKETPDVFEVEHSALGLMSMFKSQGPGILSSDRARMAAMVGEYLERKTQQQMQRSADALVDKAKEVGVSVGGVIAISARTHAMERQKKLEGMKKAQQQLSEQLDTSAAAAGAAAREKLQEKENRFREWKVAQLYHRAMRLMREELEKLPQPRPAEVARLPDEIDAARTPGDYQALQERVRAVAPLLSAYKPLEQTTQEAMALKAEMLLHLQQQELLQQLRQADVSITRLKQIEESLRQMAAALHAQNSSAQQEEQVQEAARMIAQQLAKVQDIGLITPEQATQAQESAQQMQQMVREQIKPPVPPPEPPAPPETPPPPPQERLWMWVFIILLLLLAIILCAALVILLLWLFTRRKARKLYAQRASARVFIVNLHEHIIRVLRLFSFSAPASLTPQAYASAACARFKLTGDELATMTQKFEEAKYSHHTLAPADADLCLVQYRQLIAALGKGKQIPRSLRFKALWHLTPLVL